jgi:hypothetical protein
MGPAARDVPLIDYSARSSQAATMFRTWPGAGVRAPLARVRAMPLVDPHWLLHGGLGAALRWGAQHTGLPVILVAAIALVGSWRLFKRTLRFTIEVVVAVALLLVATRLGWITW